MKIDYAFLKNFLQAKESIHNLADLMTSIGFESEVIPKNTIEFDVTPNRGDFLSLKGIAREYSAITGKSIKLNLPKSSQPFQRNKSVISFIDKSACTHYCLGVVKNVSNIKELSADKRRLLTQAEIPLIHPLVDLANYVMLEIGTPLHIFDLDKIAMPISVGYPKKQQKVKVIGGEAKHFQTSTLAIMDNDRIVAMAGIIGEESSAVSKNTINIAIESAFFKPEKIINQSRLYGLTTDAGFRFERGVDPALQEFALERYLKLLSEIAFYNSVECYREGFSKAKIRAIKINIGDFEKFSDIKLPISQAINILKDLGFEVSKLSPALLEVKVPSFRNDISIKEDIYEELLRITGYNNVPIIEEHIHRPLISDGSRLDNRIKQFMVIKGFNEVQNMPFVNPQNPDKALSKNSVVIVNPLREEEAVLRQSLLPQLIANFIKNFRRGFQLQNIFEIGSRYHKTGNKYVQDKILAGVVSFPADADDNMFLVKGLMEDLLSLASGSKPIFKPIGPHNEFSEIGLDVFNHKKQVGSFGEIKTSLIKEKQKIHLFGFEIAIDLLDPTPKKMKLRKPSKFPFSIKDLNVIVGSGVSYEDLRTAIMNAKIKDLTDISFVDRFLDKKIGNDKVSYTIRMKFQSTAISLTDKEIQHNIKQIFSVLQGTFNASLRQ